MALTAVRCPVSQTSVTLVVDIEDQPVRVMCRYFQERTHVCALKKEALAGGRLSQLLARLSEGTLGQRTVNCQWC